MSQQEPLILTQDVDGAPLHLGEPVRITPTPTEDSLDRRFLGRRGIVVALVYDEPGTQYPHEPLIQVRVEALGEDLFFPWELERAPEEFRRRFTGPGGLVLPGLHWLY
jgi:hypothetical protein